MSCSHEILANDSTSPRGAGERTLAEDLDCNWVSIEFCGDTQNPLSGGHQDVELSWVKAWSLGQALAERSEPLA